MFNTSSKILLVIGDPIGHSLSPELHNFALAQAGLADKFAFLAAHVTAEGLPAAVAGIRSLGIRGCSVTIPHKEKVATFLDHLEPLAQKIGAINTIVNSDGVLKGHNTDCAGIVNPLKQRLNLAGKKIAVLGAGGAARAAVFGLVNEGAEVLIFNRSLDRATTLAAASGALAFDLTNTAQLKDCAVIVNTTSVGMSPNVNEAPLPLELITSRHLVFDCVYNPLETALLRAARNVGAEVISGLEMFIEQARMQFELYTGSSFDTAAVNAHVLELLKRRK